MTQAIVTPGRTPSTTGPDTDILEGSGSNSSGFAHSETCDIIPNAICSSKRTNRELRLHQTRRARVVPNAQPTGETAPRDSLCAQPGTESPGSAWMARLSSSTLPPTGELSPARTWTHTCPVVQGKGRRGRSWGMTSRPSCWTSSRNLTLSQGRGTGL